MAKHRRLTGRERRMALEIDQFPWHSDKQRVPDFKELVSILPGDDWGCEEASPASFFSFWFSFSQSIILKATYPQHLLCPNCQFLPFFWQLQRTNLNRVLTPSKFLQLFPRSCFPQLLLFRFHFCLLSSLMKFLWIATWSCRETQCFIIWFFHNTLNGDTCQTHPVEKTETQRHEICCANIER